MKTFYIFDHPLLPTPYNHRFFVEKFARGFLYHGFEVKVVKDIKDIDASGFVMISKHNFYHHFGNGSKEKSLLKNVFIAIERLDITGLFNKFCKHLQFRTVKSLSGHLKGKDITLIAWFWDEEADFISGLGVPTIFTGEYFYGEPVSPRHKRWYEFYSSRNDALPIRFSADLDPKSVGSSENKKFSVSYVGNSSYKPDWYNSIRDLED